jgi:hypothetical protein
MYLSKGMQRKVFFLILGFFGLVWTKASPCQIKVPSDEVHVIGTAHPKWRAFPIKAIPHNGKAPGAKADHPEDNLMNESGKARTYNDLFDRSAIIYTLTFTESVNVSAHDSISGKAEAGISKPRGWVKCLIGAWAKVKYADQNVFAGKGKKGSDGLCVTTDGTSKTIGGGVTISNFGFSFVTSWVQQEGGHSETALLGDFDSGLTRETKEVVVDLFAFVKGTMYLEKNASGTWEAEASAGALILANIKTHSPK